MSLSPSFNLLISDLRCWVHLGCGDEEKFHPQMVKIDLEFFFKYPPKAMLTDDLNDTVCYLKSARSIQDLCSKKRFNLIEHLACDIHNTISGMLGDASSMVSSLKVSVCKASPPVPGVHGGVQAIYCGPPVLI